MRIESISIDKLKGAAYNPRRDLKPGDPDYEKLKKSLIEFDLVEPLIWNERSGNLVGGHQRLKILKERGDTEVEVSVVDLPGDKEKALNLALNKISGEWDLPKLKDILEELDTGAFDMEITGFGEQEIEELMAQFHVPEEGLTDDDEIPEQVETVCKTGGLWQLGNHRLLCGDATKKEDVDRLMGGEKADMVFTDPPYGIDYKYENHPNGNYADKFTLEEYAEFYKRLIDIGKQHSKTDAANYWWFDQSRLIEVWSAIGEVTYKELLIWSKDFYPYKKGIAKFCADYELCYYFWNERPYWSGDAFTRAVLSYATVHSFARKGKEDTGGVSSVHPTQKPTELFGRLIELSSRIKEEVLDLCGGSGSTLIACEKLGRRCFMMEIDEHYCDVIINRWQNYTGKEAVKINDN